MSCLFWLVWTAWLVLGGLSLPPVPPPPPLVPPPPRDARIENKEVKLKLVTYPVAELVAPADDQEPSVLCRFMAHQPKNEPRCWRKSPGMTEEDLLISLITNTVAPESWNNAGGPGTMQYFPLGMALVIKQTQEVHEQIAGLLARLRRLQAEQKKEYVLDMRLFEMQPNGQPKVVVLPQVSVLQGRWFTVFLGKAVALKNGSIQDLVHGLAELDTVSCQKGQAEAAADEVQVGLSVKGKVTAGEGDCLRLDLALQKNDLDSASREDLVVVGFFLRTVQRVLPGQSIEQVLQEDDEGEPQLWVEITVTETQPAEKVQIDNDPQIPRP